jgi:non-ribosomal peptide synthetase component F
LVLTYKGATETLLLPVSLKDGIKQLASNESVTLFMALLATFQVVIKHYTGSTDIVVGSDIANRTQSETEPLIGFFVNQLVLRCNLSGNPTFRELLHRVREVALDAYAHQDLPFDKLVEILRPERSTSYSPFFQLKLVLQNVPNHPATFPGLTVSEVELDRGTSQVDINLRAADVTEGLILSAEYSTDLFESTTIRRLLEHIELILAHAIIKSGDKLDAFDAIISQYDLEQHTINVQKVQDNNQQKLRNAKRKVIHS